MKTRTKRILLGASVALLCGIGGVVTAIGPRNVIGILRYDTRKEGLLNVGDPAPDVELLATSGTAGQKLSAQLRGRPLVLIFGSFT